MGVEHRDDTLDFGVVAVTGGGERLGVEEVEPVDGERVLVGLLLSLRREGEHTRRLGQSKGLGRMLGRTPIVGVGSFLGRKCR